MHFSIDPQATAGSQRPSRRYPLLMDNLRRRHGIAAELLAADYLEAQGLRILARNLYCRTGELDLVCLHAGVLVIVEVRQRARSDYGGASASVSLRKQHKIILATQYFLQRRPSWRCYPIRFDVIALEGVPDGTHRILWIQDAFRAT